MSTTYKSAGVDITAGNEAVSRIKQTVESTFSPFVLTDIGSFGALFDLQHLMQSYRHPVMVQSVDGVGTKMMVAKMMQKFDTIGIDLVSATVNDIVVLGAKPLTLLDYIANDHLNPDIIERIVQGIANACKAHGIALVGGETAEMPGTYLTGEHDLVGCITGVVEKDQAILGKDIVPGDIVLAFASSGLHTNGYSLARKIFFKDAQYNVDTYLPELSQTLGEELLIPHLNYVQPVLHLLAEGISIKGMAHITGGGLLENIPRILPANCAVEIHQSELPNKAIFNLLASLGNLAQEELYRTFNMGIGMVLIVAPDEINRIQDALSSFETFPILSIGQVISGTREVRLIP